VDTVRLCQRSPHIRFRKILKGGRIHAHVR
jgi:hypothetical protein